MAIDAEYVSGIFGVVGVVIQKAVRRQQPSLAFLRGVSSSAADWFGSMCLSIAFLKKF